VPGFNISELSASLHDSIQKVIICIDKSARISVALVTDDQGRLINTITDGDVRRGILNGISLNEKVSKLLSIKIAIRQEPVSAPDDTDPALYLQIMQLNRVKQLPLVDKEGRVTDIIPLCDVLPPPKLAMQAVVMAGGRGTRLQPLTDTIPKPMLSVGGRPLMEGTIAKLRDAGIERVDISTNYRATDIINHFGDGKDFGIDVNYLHEDSPLGTAGALGLMPPPDKTLLVINGDIITQVDYAAMLAYHNEHSADITVGVRQYGVQVPYGVIECSGPNVCKLTEKPNLTFLINAGIYLLEPSVFAFIEKNKRMDMTDLIQRLLDKGRSVVSFPIIEYWLDIGQPADYAQAQHDAELGKHKRQ